MAARWGPTRITTRPISLLDVVNMGARAVSQNNTHRRSTIDGRLRHARYRISLAKRKRIEEPFRWMRTAGGLENRQSRPRRG